MPALRNSLQERKEDLNFEMRFRDGRSRTLSHPIYVGGGVGIYQSPSFFLPLSLREEEVRVSLWKCDFLRRKRRVHASVIRFIFLSARYRRDRITRRGHSGAWKKRNLREDIGARGSGARRVYKSQNRSSERARCVMLHVRNIYDAARSPNACIAYYHT